MDPFVTMREVLRLLIEGRDVVAAHVCSPCLGPSCPFCRGSGTVQLSSLFSDSPGWRAEAEMLVNDQGVLGMQNSLLKTVVAPMLQAHRIMGEEERPLKRRCSEARSALARCTAEDWRFVCLKWIEQMERGKVVNG